MSWKVLYQSNSPLCGGLLQVQPKAWTYKILFFLSSSFSSCVRTTAINYFISSQVKNNQITRLINLFSLHFCYYELNSLNQCDKCRTIVMNRPPPPIKSIIYWHVKVFLKAVFLLLYLLPRTKHTHLRLSNMSLFPAVLFLSKSTAFERPLNTCHRTNTLWLSDVQVSGWIWSICR